jgi:cytochrome c peroxidase
VIGTDNTPGYNAITDAGATLGRVLFYDRRLSANNTTACASCHQQAFGFGDTARFSVGLHGERTARRAMALANARFYRPGRYFSDERASTLEAQVLEPIQNPVEMGMPLETLVPKLRETKFYPALFAAAFGTPEVSADRISRSLAQFVRSLVSAGSRFDRAFDDNGQPDFRLLTPKEQEGQRVFGGRGCQQCHGTNALILDGVHNTGLDATIIDAGAGGGRFKTPSLHNVAVRGPYMHDGRFTTLREVVDFYDHGVQPSPNLDPRMRGPNGTARRLNLSAEEKDALVAYLESLTDRAFLTAPKFSNPFTSGR